MSATVTDITTVKKEKGNAEKISMSLMLPVDLYDKVKLDSILSKKPVGTMLEEWLDKNVSLEDTSIDLANPLWAETFVSLASAYKAREQRHSGLL